VLETRLEIEVDGQHGPVASLGRIEGPIGAQLSLQFIGLFPAGLDVVARVLVSWSILNLNHVRGNSSGMWHTQHSEANFLWCGISRNAWGSWAGS